MATFSWMVEIAVDMHKMVRNSLKCIKDDPKRSIAITIFVTWFVPFIVSCVVFIMDYVGIQDIYKPQFANDNGA